MKTARFSLFGLALVGGTIAAVSTLLAQSPEERPDRRTNPDRRVLMLDGRGSQLGIVVEDLDAATAKDGSSGATGGVRIDDIEPDSPAEQAGLREGDLVVEYDGERVRSARQFTRLVQETPEGRTVPMGVLRDGKKQTLNVTPEGQQAAWSVGIDGARLRRDLERGLRDLPDMREFRFDGPAFDFRGAPRMSPRGRLGVQVDELSPQLADYFGAVAGGVLVTSVTESSAAAKAGLKAGDVITSVNGAAVRDYSALAAELQDSDTSEVAIGVLRDRTEMTLKATLDPDRPTRRSGRGRRPA